MSIKAKQFLQADFTLREMGENEDLSINSLLKKLFHIFTAFPKGNFYFQFIA